MAEVHMPLEQLDKLRDDLKAKDEKIKKLEADIVSIEADKRIVKVVKTIYREIPYDGYKPPSHRFISNNNHETKTYMNLDDVKQEIKEDVEKEVYSELASLRMEKKSFDRTLADERAEFKEKLTQNNKERSNDLNKFIAEHNEKYEKLNAEYTALKENRENLSKDELIIKLKEEIEKLKTKRKFLSSWF